MPPDVMFSRFRQKDIDGRWFEFDHQNKGNSCTIASTKIAKQFFSNRCVGEQALRGVANLFEAGLEGQDISALSGTAQGAHDWETTPGYWQLTLRVIRAQPLPIPEAFQATDKYLTYLKAATRNRPLLLGWSWDGGGGGHCTVCVGPTKKDASLLVILDPWTGLQYINLDDRVGDVLAYTCINPDGSMAIGHHYPGSNTFIVTK